MRARQPRTARPRMSARRRAPPASTQTTPRTDGTATRLEPANGTRGRGAHSARSRGEHRRESRGVSPAPLAGRPREAAQFAGTATPATFGDVRRQRYADPTSFDRYARRKKTECRIQAELDGRAGGAESRGRELTEGRDSEHVVPAARSPPSFMRCVRSVGNKGVS